MKRSLIIALLSALGLFFCLGNTNCGGTGGGSGGSCFPNCHPTGQPAPVSTGSDPGMGCFPNCTPTNEPSYGGQYTPPGAGGGTGGSGQWVCYRCKGRGLVWEPRNAAPPVIPGGIEICPVCGGSGNAGT